jgi:hypothetical protein
MIEMAKGGGLLPEGVVKQGHDYMTEQPVKGAKAYFMRILCGGQLSKTDHVIAPSSKIIGRVLP